jgi:hypothetical protein
MMSNALEGCSRCNCMGLCAEKIQTLELHIGRSFECARIADDAHTCGTITTETTPPFIYNTEYAPSQSPHRHTNSEGLCKK